MSFIPAYPPHLLTPLPYPLTLSPLTFSSHLPSYPLTLSPLTLPPPHALTLSHHHPPSHPITTSPSHPLTSPSHQPVSMVEDNGLVVVRCKHHLVTRFLIRDILLLVAYLWGLYIFCSKSPEHLATLMIMETVSFVCCYCF